MTKTSWAESLNRLEAKLEKYVRLDRNGEPYYLQHPTLRRLYKFHDELIVGGLANGWLELIEHDDDAKGSAA